jgi:proline dehydrogenase
MTGNLFHKAIIGTMPYLPRGMIWRFSRRYIAGTTLDDAYRAVRDLNGIGCSGTIDVLGEDITNEEQVTAALALYREALDGIRDNGLDCGISVKLSELGLRIDEGGCRAAMHELLDSTRDHDNFVRIDMEDSSVTNVTLDIYREMRADYERVGAVIQSCLRRSKQDVIDLMAEGATDIRLCKGIYIEPEAIAFTDYEENRNSFSEILDVLLEGGARVGIATHDPVLVERALASLKRFGVDKERYEFQMLLGVTERLRSRLVADGHQLRVYVPFGELWYHYSMRRLRENPHIAGHIIKNLFVRG